MCNCAGLQFLNCVGNPDCDCNGAYSMNSRSSENSIFNNAVGVNGFSNLSGEIQTLSAPTIQVSTTVPSIPAPTVSTTAPTTSISPSTLDKVLTVGTSVLGLFSSKSSSPAVAPVPLPQEDKKIPTAVWVVVGGLLLLIVVFVIVKAKK